MIRFVLHRGDHLADILRSNAEWLRELDAALSDPSPDYFMAAYGVSRRRSEAGGPTLSFQTRSSATRRADALATLFHPDAQLISLQSWATELHYRRGKAALSLVRDALHDLLPHLEFLTIDRQHGELLFRTPDGVVPLSLLSDGYQNITAWCGDLLYRITQANLALSSPLQSRGLLLIDEIDLHLHPLWQREVQQYLTTKFPNLQILATTHSLQTAQQVAKGELYILQRSGTSGLPRLIPFCGTPRELMLHQLVAPLFEIETVDSLYVESLKNEYRRLREKRPRTRDDTSRLNELRKKLRELPDWSRSHRQQSRHIRMLSEVLSAIRALRTQGKDANSSSPSTVKGQSPIGPSVPTARKSKPGKERRQLKDG